jgi:hypothetical protein
MKPLQNQMLHTQLYLMNVLDVEFVKSMVQH